MPTPTSAFVDVAARYGGVDPADTEAVQHWFNEVLPTLPPDTLEEILEDLLEHEGEGSSAEREESARTYPQGVPLPSLDSSPAAAVPLLAAGWRELLSRLTGRAGKK